MRDSRCPRHCPAIAPGRHQLVRDADAELDAAIVEAGKDETLLALAAALEFSGAVDFHREAVAVGFRRYPEFAELVVADLYEYGCNGLFEYGSRRLVIDRLQAEEALIDPGVTVSRTLLHELVHAAQETPTSWIDVKTRRGRREQCLLEGSADAMAASIYLDCAADVTAMDIAERNGPVYGPYEAVTRAVLDTVNPTNNFLFEIQEYAGLAYGSRLEWIFERFELKRRQILRRFKLKRILDSALAHEPDSRAAWTIALWNHEQSVSKTLSSFIGRPAT